MKRALIGLLLAALACAPSVPSTTVEPPVPTSGPLALELFFAARDEQQQVWLGALAGAVPDQREVFVDLPDRGRQALRPGPFGSIEPTVVELGSAESVRLVDERGEALGQLRARDAIEGRALAVHADLGAAGSVPNDLLVVGSGADSQGVVVRSGDNAISVFDLSLGIADEGLGIRLPSEETPRGIVPANPWFAVSLDEHGHEIAVTAFSQSKVYVLDLDAGQIDRALASPSAIDLDEPYTLAAATDVDGDGVVESTIRRFVPRSPQGLDTDGIELWVAFSGFVAPRLSADRPPIYLPAVVSRWSLDEPSRAPRSLVLPLANPQEVRVVDGRVFVVCSGVIDPGAQTETRDDSGIVIIDAAGQIERVIRLPDFAPSSLVVSVMGELWVSSLLHAEVLKMSADGAVLDRLVLNTDELDSVFRLTEIVGGLIAAPSFNTDRLHIIDPIRGVADGPPFFGPIVVGPGRPIFDGLQVIARRSGRPGVDFVGPDLFALSGVASRIVPIELRKVIGP